MTREHSRLLNLQRILDAAGVPADISIEGRIDYLVKQRDGEINVLQSPQHELPSAEALGRVTPKHTCGECGAEAEWVRRTQFSGDHFFCDRDARKEQNFLQEDPGSFVWRQLTPSR